MVITSNLHRKPALDDIADLKPSGIRQYWFVIGQAQDAATSFSSSYAIN